MKLNRLSGVGAFLLLLSGCASQSDSPSAFGYGEPPLNPETAIARTVSSRNIVVIGKPDPFYLRTGNHWQYGWRICASLDDGEKQGFFLLRDNKVLYKAMDTKDSVVSTITETRQYCPVLSDRIAMPAPALNQSRVGLKSHF